MSSLSVRISDLATRIGNQFRDLNSAALGDMPSSLVANKMLQVNTSGTAYELVDAPSGGSSLWTESGSDIYRASGRVGFGTNSPDYTIETDGTVNSNEGAISCVKGSYPVLFMLPYGSGNIGIGFDTYFTDDWKSSHGGSNFLIHKYNNELIFKSDTGTAGGATNTWNEHFSLHFNGHTMFKTPFHIAETADHRTLYAGWGQVWVKSDTANTLWFTDDAGADWKIGGAYFPTIGTAIDWKATDVGSKTMAANTTFTDTNLIKGNIIIFRLTGNYAPSFPTYWKDMTGSLDFDGTVVCKIVAECIESASGSELVEYYVTTQIV